MSAFAIRVEEDRVHVFTDAVYADGDGVIRGFRPMFHALAHWPGVVLICGAGRAEHPIVADLAWRFDCIDALATSAADFMEEACEHRVALFNKPTSDFQIIAAGWSRRREKPRVLEIRRSANGRDFVFFEHDKTLLSTALPREALFFAGLSDEEVEATDPVTYALATLGGMRAIHLLGLGGPPVGGYLLAADVSADGIFQYRRPVKDWEKDCIGLRIGERKPVDAQRLPRIEQGPLTFGGPPSNSGEG
jgi:hypothetical protein